jgi:glycosyltransferase involved in cell wall biosynthesis
MPLFSVVICTYNGGRRLTGALDSVLDQEASDYEVLVIDDGSEDDTADVIAGYSSPLIRYIWRPNGGLSAARNTGLAEARGDFVIFLDDDDRVDPAWLSSLGRRIDADTGVVTCGCWFHNPNTGESMVALPREMPEAFNRVTALFLAGTFAVRRELYERVGGYTEDLPISHQTELSLRLVPELHGAGMAVASVDRPLVHIERRAVNQRLWRPIDTLAGARYLLDHHGRQLARSPGVLANYHAVAGVAAYQVGDLAGSRRHFLSAARADPRHLRHAARYALSLVPALGNKVWGRHGTMVPHAPATELEVR